MKKNTLLTIMLVLCGTMASLAQDAKTVKKFYEAKDWAKAKDAADQFVTAKPSAESWFWKAKVYYAISAADETTKALAPDARNDAFNAFREAYKIDGKGISEAISVGPAAEQLGYKYVDANNLIFNLYVNNFDEAAKLYNGKKFEAAFKAFKKTDEISRFISQNKLLAVAELDTNVVFYTAASGDAAKLKDEAAPYFARLADAKLKGGDYGFIYRWLAFYYKEKKDMANMAKYSAIGRELFPEEDFYDKLEIDMARESGDINKLSQKYEDLIARNPKSFDLLYDYGTEIFELAYTSDTIKRPKNYLELQKKVEDIFKRALALNPTSGEANLALGKHYFNQGLAFEDRIKAIKGKTPADMKNKADLEVLRNAEFDKSISYIETALKQYEGKEKLKPIEKSDLKSAYTLLSDMYKAKKLPAKSNEYDLKYDNVDKKY